jgi:hypothetical protein
VTNSAAHLQAALADRYVLERDVGGVGWGRHARVERYVSETPPLGFDVALKAGDPNADFSRRNVPSGCASRVAAGARFALPTRQPGAFQQRTQSAG